MSHEIIRQFIKDQKDAKGISLQDIADRCDVKISKQAIGKYLSGGGIRDANLDALLRVFGYELHHKKVVKKK